jgi:YihY family inner membrane protein
MWMRLLGPNLILKIDRMGTYAAALAYCFVLSLVPFFIATFVVGMRLALELDLNSDFYRTHYAEVLGNIIPSQEEAKSIVTTVTNVEARSGASWLFVVGFLFALYTSYNLMEQIVRTLHFIFDDPRKQHKAGWLVIVKTISLLLLWMSLLFVISVSAVETAFLRHLLVDWLNGVHLSVVGRVIATAMQVVIPIGALFGTIFVTYYVAPARRYRVAVVVEGSLLASLGWIVCSLVFAKIMPALLKTSAAYLALGSIVAIMLWAQACAWSIILGACWIVRFSPGGRK